MTNPAHELHGFAGTRLYVVWKGMKKRCTCPTDSNYSGYGARGISVCEEWSASFLAFRRWALENGYRGGLTLDRKNTFGNYEPSNCRWATRAEQCANARKRERRSTSKFKGVSRRGGHFEVQCREKYVGSFLDEEAAARAYDARAVEEFGKFARINFPEAKD